MLRTKKLKNELGEQLNKARSSLNKTNQDQHQQKRVGHRYSNFGRRSDKEKPCDIFFYDIPKYGYGESVVETRKNFSISEGENEKRQDEDDERISTESLFDTPPQRVFSELEGICKYQNTKNINKGSPADDKGKPSLITEDTVVDTINRFRKGVEEEVNEEKKVTDKKLQKDNVSTEKVVKIKIINEQRDGKKNK
ncbi:unnamed protein product [Rhizophagus irregularis]|nr:unnamed protein product [Rhizophagus irregularis]